MIHLRRPGPISARTRAAVVALACVVAAAAGVTGAAVTVSGHDQPVQVSTPVAAPDGIQVVPAALRAAQVQGADVQADELIRREAVDGPEEYPGSILKTPDVAMAAYQRAGAVMNAASKCRLDWLVLAAIGRVESNHSRGEDGDHKLGKRGLAKPAIVGQPLNGRHGRGEFADTDAGQLDQNKRWDAPVGALALMPTTWSSVAVDADGDGQRNPQDIDDAALGAAVFLCADDRKLNKPAQLRKALTTYHHAPGFVKTVQGLAKRYEKQSAKVPDFVPPTGVPIPDDMPSACGCDEAGTSTRTAAEGEDTATVDSAEGATNKDGRSSDPSPKTRASDSASPIDPAASDPPSSTDPTPSDPPGECGSPTEPSPTEPSPTEPSECPSETVPPATESPGESPTAPSPTTEVGPAGTDEATP